MRLIPQLVLMTTLCGSAAWASEQRVKVLGSAILEATVTRSGGDRLRLEGSLTDDAGLPVSGAALRLTLPAASPAALSPCAQAEPGSVSPDGLGLTAGSNGRFCAELGADLENLPVLLHYADPAGLLGEARLEVVAAPAPLGLELQLRAPAELPLDTPLHVLEVSALPPEDVTASATSPAAWSPLRIALGLEAPHRERRELGEVLVRPGERGRLELDAAKLGPPGSSVLVARFAGDAVWAPAEARRHTSKTALVFVEGPSSLSADWGQLPLDVAVRARWKGGGVPTGSVEATWGTQRIGAAALIDGQARLRLDPSQELLREIGAVDDDSARLPLTLSYVANAPWWQAGPPAHLELTLAPPSPWSRLPWFFAALATALWVTVIWRRPASRGRPPPTEALGPPGRAGLAVVTTDGDALTGQVLDAHSGAAVPEAVVEVLVPALNQMKRLSSTRCSGSDGTFALDRLDEVDTAGATPRIRISAPGYALLERALPQRGHLVIHLVTLRRSIVERLLKWAHRKGGPWSGPLPPTPAHIARLAESRREDLTAKWARRVEAAAFGPEHPSEEVDRELHEGEPR